LGGLDFVNIELRLDRKGALHDHVFAFVHTLQDGMVIVLEGVHEGEDVVVKGAFAIKSELDIHKIEPTQ
jgi:hypothetical protein